jgi:copper chaperone CopZ
MRNVLIASLVLFASSVFAESKTFKVDGMHCADCAATVTEKLCDKKKYSTCDVKVIDEEKEIGQIKLVTKDKKAKIDMVKVAKIIEDEGYKVSKK